MTTTGDLSHAYRRYLAAVVLFHLAAADEAGMGATDLQAWNLLGVDGPMTSGELARRLAMSTGATTRLIDRLEEAGAAQRVAEVSDRRRTLVESAAEAPPALQDLLAAAREPIAAVIASLDDHQRDGLESYLRAAGEAYAEAAREVRSRGR